MIKSMTGYGIAKVQVGEATLTAEIRSLNSKFLDLSVRLPRAFQDKEIEIRNLLSERLERGKISVNVELERPVQTEPSFVYNEALFMRYYLELKKLADRVLAPYDPLFQIALNAPDVTVSKTPSEPDAATWEAALSAVSKATDQCDQFRIREGGVLGGKLSEYIQKIESCLAAVATLDPARVERVRARLQTNTKSFFTDQGWDANRLEQEILYYVEKLDIHEERVRLATHLKYFADLLAQPAATGKKLGFLAQEIGREINTIGSKANDAAIQKEVVAMKEELEKIKEQLNNVL
ncbi:MAG TPA: YicC family protein [Cytophagales bacterium]|nr:YicC family protein [Cytophagales bacterium]